jgi:hypothetical protein
MTARSNRHALPALALALAACSSGSTAPPKDAGAGGSPVADAGPPPWKPGVVMPSIGAGGPRGMLDLRGLIHAHSVYSHDACDGAPRDDAGAINQPCFDDFRAGICKVGHDYVMLTDHNESFGRTEFPDTLLFRADRGDQLVTRDGAPVANRLACPGGATAPLLLAGTESATMPVGLEGHVPGTVDERMGVYGDVSADAIAKFKAMGAVALVQHTEDWTVDQLTTLPLDGFEMYNVHANLKSSFSEAVGLILKLQQPDQFPQSDLVLLPLFEEDPVYLSTWASVLASGARRVTTMASDCHRNSFPQILPDGERVDSYRRMMQWFSNHLLVTPDAQGNYDDRSLKDALRAGRLYGAFEFLGYPVGFDWRAEEAGAVREMGAEVSLAKGVSLRVSRPHVDRLDPAAEAPRIVARILRAEQGSWSVAAEGEDDLAFTPAAPGVYRAEVRMTPRHLRKYLASYADLADKDFPWVYGNAIYVVP